MVVRGGVVCFALKVISDQIWDLILYIFFKGKKMPSRVLSAFEMLNFILMMCCAIQIGIFEGFQCCNHTFLKGNFLVISILRYYFDMNRVGST